MRAYKAILHFNKQGSTKNRPWTVHYRGVCYLVSEIECRVPMRSEFKPDRKTNPRAFFTAQVRSLVIKRNGSAILT
jgi:hypothetical protein